MAKSRGSSYRIACPACQASLKAWPDQAGAAFRCPRCGTLITIPTAAEAAAPPPPPFAADDRPPSDDEYGLSRDDRPLSGQKPAYINIVCPICSTRMYATPDQVGQSLVCPDCDTNVEVTAPPVELYPESPHTRIVYEGSDEYPLRLDCGQDETPAAPGEIPAAPGRLPAEKERYVAVVCPLCHTRMHATLGEVGRKKACPDCGTLTVVPAPPKPEVKPPRRPLEFEGGEEYALRRENSPNDPRAREKDPVQIPVVCPLCQTRMHASCEQVGKTITCPDCGTPVVVLAPPASPPLEVELIEPYGMEELPSQRKPLVEELPPRAARGAGQGEAGEEIVEEFPEPPPWPMLSGVFRFVEHPDALARLLGISLAAILALLALDFSISILASLTQGIAMAARALVGTISLLLAALFALFWLVVTSAQCLGILEQSAQGHDRIESPDPVWLDWVFDLFYFVNGLALATIPGLLLAQWYEPGSPKFIAAIALSQFFLFPVVMLSMLEQGSAIHPFSGVICRAMVLAFTAWVQFYIAAAVLLGAMGLMIWPAMNWMGSLRMLVIGPVLTVGLMLYFRLLGRLGWCCTAAVRRARLEEAEGGAGASE